MAVSANDKKQIAVVSLLGLLLLWALWHFTHETPNNNPAVETPDLGQATQPTDTALESPSLPSVTPGSSCGCNSCNSCPSSFNSIPTVNQIIAQTVAFTNAINAAGNQTLQALAAMERNENSLVEVTVG